MTFELCPGFRGPLVQRLRPKIGENEVSYRRVGWGYFDLPTKIHFKPELKLQPIETEFELEFDEGGYMFTV